MEEFLNNVLDGMKGSEFVDWVKVGNGFAMLFDDGTIITITDPFSTTFTTGEGWSALWDELKLNEVS